MDGFRRLHQFQRPRRSPHLGDLHPDVERLDERHPGRPDLEHLHPGVDRLDVGHLGVVQPRLQNLNACPAGKRTGCYLGVGHLGVDRLGVSRSRHRRSACPAAERKDCFLGARHLALVHPDVGCLGVERSQSQCHEPLAASVGEPYQRLASPLLWELTKQLPEPRTLRLRKRRPEQLDVLGLELELRDEQMLA
ncbi:hypothetical protein GCM10027027_00060 [Neomicrococcus lactis]